MPGLDLPAIQRRLAEIVQQNGLQALYPEQRLQSLANEVARKDLQGLAIRWRLESQVPSNYISIRPQVFLILLARNA